MIYYENENIMIRSMKQNDAQIIYDEYIAQNWHHPIEVLESYYKDQENNKKKIFIAEYNGDVAGYTTLIFSDSVGPFAHKEFPVVVDFSVFIKYRNKGIGNKILDVVEDYASKISDTICLGVGLHSGYGSAQRMYIKRGYVPDGTGVWYQDKNLEQYADCKNDDDLILYLSKSLRRTT